MPRVLLDQSKFVSTERAWQPFAARMEICPDCAVATGVSRSGRDGSLQIQCRDAVQYGGWARTIPGIKTGAWYRFDAYYRAERVRVEQRAMVARLDWRDRSGGMAGRPYYVYQTEDAGDGWKHVWALAPAPDGAASVRLELLFGWSPGGTVWWDEIRLSESDPPAPRPVRIATIHHVPKGNASAHANIEEFCDWIDRVAESKPDIICLPEGMTMVGTGLTYEQVAEPIPGPTSERLGEKARQHGCYLVACYGERHGSAIYNTAILVDRKGKLAGKYRKAYLPREEVEAGVAPGDECPVFETDFGKVGLMICWDVQYTEPAQRLALKGAEIVLLPIWDGSETLMKARAIENRVFLVTCAYGNPSWVLDPDGQVLAEAGSDSRTGVAIADIDLSRRYGQPWIDEDMRAHFFKEHRGDLR